VASNPPQGDEVFDYETLQAKCDSKPAGQKEVTTWSPSTDFTFVEH